MTQTHDYTDDGRSFTMKTILVVASLISLAVGSAAASENIPSVSISGIDLTSESTAKLCFEITNLGGSDIKVLPLPSVSGYTNAYTIFGKYQTVALKFDLEHKTWLTYSKCED